MSNKKYRYHIETDKTLSELSIIVSKAKNLSRPPLIDLNKMAIPINSLKGPNHGNTKFDILKNLTSWYISFKL